MASVESVRSQWRLRDYYHGYLRREFVEDRLENNGEFLVRKSMQEMWVVSIRWNDLVYHVQPFYDGKRYSFGALTFETFEELVKFHWLNAVPMTTYEMVLKRPIRRLKLIYKSDDIEVVAKLGEGTFADVYRVTILSENRPAAMKAMKGAVDARNREAFLTEMNMMISVRHRNIVGFVGIVDDVSQMKLLMELANKGSLDKLLARKRLTDLGKLRVITHVAKGMRYLHLRRILHRDLAARNILVHRNDDGGVSAKVGDFGLSRSDDETHGGYELRHSQRLPVKWMAPESFVTRCWTTATDVWSYGVLMWEVFTDGADPYADWTDMPQLSQFIARGGHPCLLEDVNRDMHALMVSCWALDPAQRPTMDNIVHKVEQIFPRMTQRSAKKSATLS